MNMMTDHSSTSLLEIWQCQMNDSTTYWQEWFKAQMQGIDPLTPWQPLMDQSYAEWSSLWQQWHNALQQWLTNWSNISGCTLQSNPPFGMLFPPLEDLSRLNQALIQLMEQSTDSILTGIGALAPGRAAELTEHVTQLETAISHITGHLEAISTRLETSEASDIQSELAADMAHVKMAMADVTQHLERLITRIETADTSVMQQVEALRGQMQTTHEATAQQLTALAQRLDEAKAPPTRSNPRTTTRRKPQS
jgi:hypothetical protein